MSTCVCVLSNSGERLMPTFRLGKVRRLLKDGKAKIVKHHPFTIQLLYDSRTNTQPIEICEDVGYNYIGISVKSESHEYVSAQYDTLQDEKEHHDDCRKMRRARRNRLRYRKPRFDNRKRSEGWLAPSLEHKKQLNISLIERYVSVIPITRATNGKSLFNGRISRSHKKDSENLHKYRGKRIRKGYRALTRKKVNLNPGDLVSLNGEVLVVHGTHTNKKGAVNVEFKTPAKSGQKSTSLKKLKIVKAADSIHPAWEKVS